MQTPAPAQPEIHQPEVPIPSVLPEIDPDKQTNPNPQKHEINGQEEILNKPNEVVNGQKEVFEK